MVFTITHSGIWEVGLVLWVHKAWRKLFDKKTSLPFGTPSNRERSICIFLEPSMSTTIRQITVFNNISYWILMVGFKVILAKKRQTFIVSTLAVYELDIIAISSIFALLRRGYFCIINDKIPTTKLIKFELPLITLILSYWTARITITF